MLGNAVAAAPIPLRTHLQQIATHDNVPRKEKQFRNFVANSMRLSHQTVDQIWNFLKQLREKQQQQPTQAAQDSPKNNSSSSNTPDETKDHPAANVTDAEAVATVTQLENTKATQTCDNKDTTHLPSSNDVKKTMKKLLKKEKDKAMSMKHLRKAVCAKYKLLPQGRKQIKRMVQQHCTSGKKFAVEGTTVRLLSVD